MSLYVWDVATWEDVEWEEIGLGDLQGPFHLEILKDSLGFPSDLNEKEKENSQINHTAI